MSEEMMTEVTPELFQLKSGQLILSEELSRKMFYIMNAHPESRQLDNSGYSWDESGMAELFSECYKNDTRYCPEAKSWYTYDNGAWRKDVGSLLVAEKIKEFTRLMVLYCGEITDEEKRKSYFAFVNKMGDRRFRDRLMKDAASVYPISASQFDANPNLINCLNGTYDLETMSFREHDWRDYLTMQTNFEYTMQDDIRCERWEEFIREVTSNDKEKADYLQRALGYSMLGTSKSVYLSFTAKRPVTVSQRYSEQFTTCSEIMLLSPPCRLSARPTEQRTQKQLPPQSPPLKGSGL